jgi:hypothetical protein
MNNKVAIISGQSVGGTFLDWSIHWLSGADKFYNCDLGWIDLVDDPIMTLNAHGLSAHGHQKNHPGGFKRTVKVINQLAQIDTNLILSLYSTIPGISIYLKESNIDAKDISAHSNDILEFQKNDFSKMWDLCYDRGYKLIYLKSTDTVALQNIRVLTPITDHSKKDYNSVDEYRQAFLNLFFNKDLVSWEGQLNMTNIWDRREFIALNVRPFVASDLPNYWNFDESTNFRLPHYYLNANDFYVDGKRVLLEILDYLEVEVNDDRLDKWISVYDKWRQPHLNTLKFSSNINYIIDSIINNYYYNLKPLKLDLWQEAIIQHILIYKHGLNLKTWGLEKFPNNTQELHTLLESNIHKIKDIYGVLNERNS